MNASLADFESFSNKYVSRTSSHTSPYTILIVSPSGSDVIAIGATFAVASCGGPLIPFRGGRVDALSAGTFGVPEPYQDLQTHLDIFHRQGFSQTEMITLVACGHTIGGVRSTDFPGIVPPEGDPERPTFAKFDTSDKYDNLL